MKKILKISGISLAVLLIFMLIAPFLFKGKIIEVVKEQINKNINAKVEFTDVHLSLFRYFPDFSFKLDNLSVVGIDKFKSDTLANIEELVLELDLMSVIKGDEYKIKKILIQKPDLKFLILKDGSANWDITKPTPEDTTTSETTFKLNLKSFEISDANILYDDKEGNMYTQITGMDFDLGGDMTASETDLNIKTMMKEFTFGMEGMDYLKKVNIVYNAKIAANLDSFAFVFKENVLTMNKLEVNFDGKVAMPTDDIYTDIKFSTKQSDFKTLLSLVPAFYTKDFEKIQTKGNIAFSGWAKGIYNDSLMPAFNLQLLVNNAMVKYPDLPASIDDINIDTRINSPSSNMNDMTVDVRKFHLSLIQNPIDMHLFMSNLMVDPSIDGGIKGKLDLASLKKVYPMEDGMDMSGVFDMDVTMKGKMSSIEKEKYDEFLAAGNMNINAFKFKSKDLPEGVEISSAQMSFNPKSIDLVKFVSIYNKAKISAQGKVENYMGYAFKDAILKGNLTIQSDLLDMNTLMPAETNAAPTKDTAASAPMTVIEIPANIDFTLKATIGKLIYDNINMQNVLGEIQVVDQTLKIKTAKMDMLGGNIAMSGNYSSKEITKPTMDIALNITHFDIPEAYKTFNTIQKMSPIAQYIKGNFSGNITLRSVLDKTMMPVMNTLNSTGSLKMSALEIVNADVLKQLSAALKYDKFNKMNTEPFALNYEIINGDFYLKPTTIKVDNMPMQISGKTNLDQSIEYVMDMKIPRSKLGTAANLVIGGLENQAKAAGLAVNQSDNVEINALITGKTTAPVVKLAMKNQANDLKKQMEDKAKAELEKAKQQALDEANRLKNEAEQKANQLKKDAEAKAKAEIEKQKAILEQKKKEEEAKLKKKLEEEAKNKLKNIKIGK